MLGNTEHKVAIVALKFYVCPYSATLADVAVVPIGPASIRVLSSLPDGIGDLLPIQSYLKCLDLD